MTARSKRYGKPGDILEGPGVLLRLLEVGPMPLAHVAEGHWVEEGCESPEEFQRIWEELHPRRGYRPTDLVYAHRFEVVHDG